MSNAPAESTLRSTDPPFCTDVAVAKPSMPVACPIAQPESPGKQFSRTTAFPVEHARALGTASTVSDAGDEPPGPIARTVYEYVTPFVTPSPNVVAVIPVTICVESRYTA